ncbi:MULTISPECIES: thiamine diphosphokinase [Alphaproteobacteria]|uniref:Thiamine diphosphokinase n=2 Tax=Alphaproteobacteria TaxID=28211 RepID=A0A512HK69_9HYPH|nr:MULTISPECIES: thiamine diphosphokinase [Alphaproteobacteria]GEO85835.1 thiamine pyrophosphokinase [Ciceribacter naphthalenivorans]
MTDTTFTILLGGALTPTERLRAAVAGSRAIAADGGMRHAAALGLSPELWVGDFDSSADLPVEDFPGVPRMPYPAQKASTDGEIAVEQALSRGATRLVLAGALGGERSDHAVMHLLSGVALAKAGIDVMMSSGTEEAFPLLRAELTLDLPKGSLFSILGFSPLAGLTIGNARYPLTDFALAFGSSRTISNVAEGPVSFSLKSGDAVILARPYDLSGA